MSRPDPWLLGIGATLAVALVGVLAAGFGRDPRAVPAALEHRPAPAFELTDLDGTPHALADLAGKPAVLNFWSTWCQPCKLEHAALQEAARRYPGVTFLGVVYDDEAEAARRHLQRAGSAYPNLLDPTGRVAVEFGVAGVPETYFIDARGIVARKFSGPLTRREIDEILAPLLEKP